MDRGQRFATIDAARGLAALCVLLFHARIGSPLPFTGGYLAVDLFFALSGFVIAHAYADRLRQGMGLREFAVRRIVRLWPMVVPGALLAIVLHNGHAGMIVLWPNMVHRSLFPANPAFWSLLAELIVNLAFALALPFLTVRVIACVAAAALCVIALTSGTPPDINTGFRWDSFGSGLARAVFGFAAGVLVHAALKAGRIVPRTTLLALVPLAASVALFVAIPQEPGWAAFAAMLAMPLILLGATAWELPWHRAAKALGDLSYPLYCIHMPLLALQGRLAVPMAALCTAIVVIAWLAERYYERPVRRLLAAAVRRSEAGKPPVRRASA